MEVEEIFSEVWAHQIEGVMFHDQMARYFEFLGLRGFQMEQELHFMQEATEQRVTNRYFVTHYKKLIPEKELKNPSVIPMGWYKYSQDDVDSATRRNAVKEAFEKWVAWETETKELYEKAVKELYDIGTVAGAITIEKLVADVDKELENARQEKIELESVGYDPTYIADIQRDVIPKYMGLSL